MSPQADVNIKIEVGEDHLLVIFPYKMDNFVSPWQNFQQLGTIMEIAANTIKEKGLIDPIKVDMEQSQVAFNEYGRRYVAMLFQHTDRLKFSYHAAIMVARAMRMKAQDVQYKDVKKTELPKHSFFNRRQRPI